MTTPAYAILFSAKVDGAASNGGPGDVLIKSASTGLYVKATTAERGTRRSTGMALTNYVAGGTVEILQFGEIDATTANLGAGSASWVRVSAAGTLERASVSGSDDVCGWIEADGTFKACFGFLTAAMTTGGGGGGTPGGADTQVQYNNAGAFAGTSGATVNGGALRLTTPSIWNPAVTFRYIFGGSAIVANRSVTLPLLGADDTFTFNAHTQTLTNKTLTSPTITGATLTADKFGQSGSTTTVSAGSSNNQSTANRKIRVTSACAFTGFDSTGMVDGDMIWLIVDGAVNPTLAHENASSSAANRIHTISGGTSTLLGDGVTMLWYDATISRWREIQAGNFIP